MLEEFIFDVIALIVFLVIGFGVGYIINLILTTIKVDKWVKSKLTKKDYEEWSTLSESKNSDFATVFLKDNLTTHEWETYISLRELI